jgi:hypothetical protein
MPCEASASLQVQLSGPTYIIQGVLSVYHSEEIFRIKLCRVNIFNRHALTPPLSLSLSKIAWPSSRLTMSLNWYVLLAWPWSLSYISWGAQSVIWTSSCALNPSKMKKVHNKWWKNYGGWTWCCDAWGHKAQPLVRKTLEHSHIWESELWFHPKIYRQRQTQYLRPGDSLWSFHGSWAMACGPHFPSRPASTYPHLKDLKFHHTVICISAPSTAPSLDSQHQSQAHLPPFMTS